MTGELHSGILLMQATVCLVLGLGLSTLWARKPARAHQILLIGMIACVLLPGLSIGVQHLGLGLLTIPTKAPTLSAATLVSSQIAALSEPPETVRSTVDLEMPFQTKPIPDLSSVPRVPQATRALLARPVPWHLTGMGLWCLMSFVLLVRLARQFTLGIRLIRDHHPVEDTVLMQALSTAKRRLGFNRPVALCTNRIVSSPVIWCWRKSPILLVQDCSTRAHACCDWVGVFCHELAHVKRLDHVTNLWADLLRIALPWHPLVWWARYRLLRLSEDVCDDWALAQAQTGTQYAESLLAFTSQKQLALVPGIIGKDRTMKERISRIIKGQISNPRPGAGWTCLLVMVTLCSIVGMALAQPGPEQALRSAAPHEFVQEAAMVRQEARQESMEIAKIGRLNVLRRLLDQLTDQTEAARQALKREQSDSDRHMREVELDTLQEQTARIKEQIRQTEAPESELEQRRVRQVTAAARNRQNAVAAAGRAIIQSQRVAETNQRQMERRGLEERRRQLVEKLRTMEQELRLSAKVGQIPADEMNARLRELKNELGMINVQLDKPGNTPEPQMRIYRLEHSQAQQMADTLLRVVRQANIIADDNSNSLIVSATPDKQEQVERLLKELDTARTVTSSTSVSRASRAPRASSTSSASGPVSTGTAPSRVTQTARSTTQASRAAIAGTARSRPPRQDSIAGSSMNTRGSAGQNLNAEVDELRGQVKGLNAQMQEMRALLQQLIQQKKPSPLPDVSN